MAVVLGYLEREDPALAARVRERYACFEPFGGDSQAYGLMTGLGSTPSCEEGVIRMLLDPQHRRAQGATDVSEDPEARFDALIHVDRTRAVVPLEADRPWLDGRASHEAEAPETYPQGL